jgi:UPF0755 protein
MTPLFGKGGDAERSAAEREAARLERARRRAEREGRPLPEGVMPVEQPPVEQPPPVDDPVEQPPAEDPVEQPPVEEPVDEPAHVEEPVEQPVHVEPPAPHGAPPEVEPVVYEHPHEPDPYEPVAYEPEGEPVVYEQTHDTPRFERTETDDQPALQDTGSVGTLSLMDERPSGVRRVGAPSVRDLPQVAGPKPPGRPPRGFAPPRRRRRRRRLLLLIPVILLAAAGWAALQLFQPFAGDGAGSVRVTIPSGSTAGEVGDLLEQRGVVDSSFFFSLRARLAGKRDALKAGTFTLRKDMSYAAAIDALTKNPAPPPVIRVTVPEGRSIREAAPLVRQSGLAGSYVQAAQRSPRRTPGLRRFGGVPSGTRTLEGFLFPATYELKRGSTQRDLVDEQIAAFRDNWSKLDLRAARRKNLTPYDVLIIASMIEREAGVAKDRPLISAVIYNRLKERMALGIDATLRYHLNNWSRPLRVSELNTNSAFNTRKHTGLPPTPIGSPGLASIKAALKPAKVPYVFYVVKPCGNGAHAFSATDAQFQKDVAAYNRKRDALGGKDPSRC